MAGLLIRKPELCPHLAPPNLTVLPFTEAETICLEHINSSQTTCQNICEHLMAGGGWQKWRRHSYRQWQISCGRFCSAEDRRRQGGTERRAVLPQLNTGIHAYSPSLGYSLLQGIVCSQASQDSHRGGTHSFRGTYPKTGPVVWHAYSVYMYFIYTDEKIPIAFLIQTSRSQAQCSFLVQEIRGIRDYLGEGSSEHSVGSTIGVCPRTMELRRCKYDFRKAH